jgi:hypothetical protein
MGVEHLDGKRTGRPRGAKSRPWVRELLWAYRNLGNPDAEPSSALAGRLLALGREHPDRFFACLMQLKPHATPDTAPPGEQPHNGNAAARKLPPRVRKLVVEGQYLLTRLTGDGSAYLSGIPHGAAIVDCAPDPEGNGVVFILHSGTFPPVLEGVAIPRLKVEYTRGRSWDD